MNIGSLVENMVFNTLKSRTEVRYGIIGSGEIDFITGDCICEVKYKMEIDDEEIKHLMKIRGKKKKIVITYDLNEKREGIQFIPLYRFLLEYQ